MINVINRIVKLNEERYSKNFDKLKEQSFIVEEISEGLRRYDDINELLDFNADIAIFSIGGLYKYMNTITDNVDVPGIIYRLVDVIYNQNNLETYVKNPKMFKELIECDCNTPSEKEFNDTVLSKIKFLSENTRNFAKEEKISDDLILVAQINSYYNMLLRYNVIMMSEYNVPDAEYEFVSIFSSFFMTALIIIESFGYDAVKVLDEAIKHIESRTGKLNEATGKWEKDAVQENLYIPDYASCKLNESE